MPNGFKLRVCSLIRTMSRVGKRRNLCLLCKKHFSGLVDRSGPSGLTSSRDGALWNCRIYSGRDGDHTGAEDICDVALHRVCTVCFNLHELVSTPAPISAATRGQTVWRKEWSAFGRMDVKENAAYWCFCTQPRAPGPVRFRC